MTSFVGLDIGYSNVKMTYSKEQNDGKLSDAEDVIFPVGVATLNAFNNQRQGITGSRIETTEVLVDGIYYAAGIEPGLVIGSSRDISENYAKTMQYKALFHAALLHVDDTHIARLVTGLPVSHWQDETFRQWLVDLMKGEHKVAEKRTVIVDEVEVIPQPGGAFLDAIEAASQAGDDDKNDLLKTGIVLVADPGYYSTDWVVFEEGALNYELSGTTLMATSRIIERTAELITKEYGAAPGKGLKPEKVEKLIRSGGNILRYASQKIDITTYRDQASREVSGSALSEISGSMRNIALDATIIAGGGGNFFEESIKETFPKCEHIATKEPVKAIARGYHGWASRA